MEPDRAASMADLGTINKMALYLLDHVWASETFTPTLGPNGAGRRCCS